MTTDAALLALDQAREQLEQLNVDLDHVAAWRADLGERLWRARWQIEICGLDEDEQDRLAAEVHTFKRICKALKRRAA